MKMMNVKEIQNVRFVNAVSEENNEDISKSQEQKWEYCMELLTNMVYKYAVEAKNDMKESA